MPNCFGEKSPTVRFATERPERISAVTSRETFNTSEPTRCCASEESEASVTRVRTSVIAPRIVRAMNLPEVLQRAPEVGGLDLGALDVAPDHDRELVDGARGGVTAALLHEAGDDLDVEDPARDERLGEELADS